MDRKIVIFDIDGTIANCDHRRHFVTNGNSDWDSFKSATKDDTPIQWVCDIARNFATGGAAVVFVSARNNAQRQVTINQIKLWIGIDNPILFMRPDGDNTPDDIFKKGVMDVIQDQFGTIDLVFDDRNRVVDMWRDNGIPVFQVVDRSQGDF
jgi:hypothetical protein